MAHPVVHFEIGCRDKTKTEEFYSKLFGWQMQPYGPATMIGTGGHVGGHITELGHEPYRYAIFYVQTGDVQASLDKAQELGGKTLVPPVEIPNGTFAWFTDPEGNFDHSHQVSEAMDDPLVTNPTPLWGGIGQVSGNPQEPAFWSWYYNSQTTERTP